MALPTPNPLLVFGPVACQATADGTVNTAVLNKNCPWPIKIISAWYNPHTLRTGGTPAHTVKLQRGDGAATETFADITDAKSVQGTVDTVLTPTTVDDAQHIIRAGESIRAVLVVSGTTTGQPTWTCCARPIWQGILNG